MRATTQRMTEVVQTEGAYVLQQQSCERRWLAAVLGTNLQKLGPKHRRVMCRTVAAVVLRIGSAETALLMLVLHCSDAAAAAAAAPGVVSSAQKLLFARAARAAARSAVPQSPSLAQRKTAED